MRDYSYQTKIAEKIFKECINKKNKAAVLAATPGSGKTSISHIVISRYIKKYPEAKILVLTHGQNILKNQYIESLQKPHVNIGFSFGEFDSGKQVLIGLPHSIKKLPLQKIDLLIVDECHEYYLKPMVQGIINTLKPNHQVLLTGSPSEFNRLKKEGHKYSITYLCAEDLIKNNIFSPVTMGVVPVDYHKDSQKTLKQMIEYVKQKNFDLSKIMVVAKNVKEAKNISYFLKKMGRKVALSTYRSDKNNQLIESFKSNKYDTLVVVMKGILGFSDNNITGLFDLRCSENVDISNQLFARVLRKHPDNINKFYYRCGQKGDHYNKQVIMLYKIKSLMRRDVFTKYDGYNMTMRVA